MLSPIWRAEDQRSGCKAKTAIAPYTSALQSSYKHTYCPITALPFASTCIGFGYFEPFFNNYIIGPCSDDTALLHRRFPSKPVTYTILFNFRTSRLESLKVRGHAHQRDVPDDTVPQRQFQATRFSVPGGRVLVLFLPNPETLRAPNKAGKELACSIADIVYPNGWCIYYLLLCGLSSSLQKIGSTASAIPNSSLD